MINSWLKRSSIWRETLGKHHINAAIVLKFIQRKVILKDISDHTLGRNHINVIIVIKLTQEKAIVTNICLHIQEISHTIVASVKIKKYIC